MIFGNPNSVAIEVGEFLSNYGNNGPYVQFQFIIESIRIGDWNDRIPLLASVERAVDFQASRAYRRNDSLERVSSTEFFSLTFDAFYNYDYASQPILLPNLRDRHQLSEIGMGALSDKIGITVADVSLGWTRIVVKDLRSNQIVADQTFPSSDLDEACNAFVSWGKEVQASLAW